MRKLLTVLLLLVSVATFAQKSGKNAQPLLGYDKIYPFKESAGGKIAKVEKGGKQGFIKEDGSEFVAPMYDNIYPWEKGRAKVENAGKYGFIKEADGEEFIPVKYEYIGPFKNGMAIISNLGRRGLISETGEIIVPLD